MSSSYKCQYCKSQVLDNYCSSCRSHFILLNNTQKYVSVDMDDLDYLSLSDKLCPSCTIYYNTQNYIICSSFIDYFKKLKFCHKCKNDNSKFIRNMFYKNFLFYRRLSCFSKKFIIFYLFLFSFFNEFLVFYIFSFFINFKSFGFFENCFLNILGLFRKYKFFRFFYLFFVCFFMKRKKRFLFHMPINLEKSVILDKHIKDLKI